MPTREFTEELLMDIFDRGANGYERIRNDYVDKSRWKLHYEFVFKDVSDNTYWRVTYARGATEYQDEGMEFDSLTAVQVQPVEVVQTTIVYEEVS